MSLWVLFIFVSTLFLAPSVHSHDAATIITIKEDGFDPAEISIHKGDEVVFKNDDKQEHWPASDLHPTHNIYSEFDPKVPIQPGKTWRFKFEKTGKFKLHDHLFPHLGGVITVSDSDEVATDSAKPDIPDINASILDNIKPYFLRIYYYLFPEKLYQELQKYDALKISQDEKQLKYWLTIIGGEQFMNKLTIDTDGGSKVDCHQEAHIVGRMSYDLFKSTVFQKINYNCHSGYIHGAIESFIKEHGAKNKLMGKLEDLCKRYKTDFSNFECLHGIGHGVLAYVNYDLPRSLNMCSELSTDYDRRSCFGGVFMENIMAASGKGAIKGHKTDWANNDPHFPCNSVLQTEIVQTECYQMQTSRMLQLSNYDFKYIVNECLRAPTNMVAVCFRSMGRDIAGQVLRDQDQIINLCQLSPPNQFQECLRGGLNVIVDFWGENITDQPQKLCNKLVNPKDKSYCFQTLGERLVNVFGANRAKIEDLCKVADPIYYQTCLSSLHKS